MNLSFRISPELPTQNCPLVKNGVASYGVQREKGRVYAVPRSRVGENLKIFLPLSLQKLADFSSMILTFDNTVILSHNEQELCLSFLQWDQALVARGLKGIIKDDQ